MLMKIRRTKRKKSLWKREMRTKEESLNREGAGHGTDRCPDTGLMVPVAGTAGEAVTRIL